VQSHTVLGHFIWESLKEYSPTANDCVISVSVTAVVEAPARVMQLPCVLLSGQHARSVGLILDASQSEKTVHTRSVACILLMVVSFPGLHPRYGEMTRWSCQ
jgi:hypothetical protein